MNVIRNKKIKNHFTSFITSYTAYINKEKALFRIRNAPINLSHNSIMVTLADMPKLSKNVGSPSNALPVPMSMTTEATLIILKTDRQYRFASFVDVRKSDSSVINSFNRKYIATPDVL
jgi:hypothetical protein